MKKMKKMRKRTVFPFLCSLLVSMSAMADIGSDLDGYFSSLGYSSNTTSPNAYHGQQAGYYTGGSISTRNQVRDVSIVQVDLPSYRTGCGGIDVFGGSLSVITKKDLNDMLHNILGSAGSYAFTLALETMTPEIANVMKYWNDWLGRLNQSNLNSCEMAESLVGGAWPKIRGAHERVCEDLGTSSNYFASWAEARQGCGFGGDYDAAMNNTKNVSKSSQYKDIIPDGNIVWRALQKRPFLHADRELAELFMSLSGTVVFWHDAGKDGATHTRRYPALADNNDLVSALLRGGKASVYQCDTTEVSGCLGPARREIIIPEKNAFRTRVAGLLRSMAEKAQTDKPLTAEEISLLGATSLPIYKMINVQSAWLKDGSLPDVEQYADVIAADILYQYLHEALSVIRSSVAMLPFPQTVLAGIEPGIERQMAGITQKRQGAWKDIAVSTQLVEQTQLIERQLTGEFSSQFASTVSWAKGLR